MAKVIIPKRAEYQYSQFYISTCEVRILKDDNCLTLRSELALTWTYVNGIRSLKEIAYELNVNLERALTLVLCLKSKKLLDY